MKALIQRVSQASVSVAGAEVSRIGAGMLVLVGLEKGDTDAQLVAQTDKILKLRIFADEADKMNRSIQDIQGELLVVSQFTLAGDCRKGNRPGFDNAMPPEEARPMFDRYVSRLRKVSGLTVQTGVFAAMMNVALVNDGPVTFLLEHS